MKKARNFLICFLCTMQVMVAMQENRQNSPDATQVQNALNAVQAKIIQQHNLQGSIERYNYEGIKPVQSAYIFDFSRKSKDTSSASMLFFPNENDNTVLIAKQNGTVSSISYDDNQERCLIKHYLVKHIRMMFAAHKAC